MVKPPIFFGKVEKGRIVLDNKARFTTYLQGFEGHRIELVLREKRTTRTESQNSYYHAVVVEMLAEHTGQEHEAMHEDIKEYFHIISTAKLKTGEFENILEKIRRWAFEFHGLVIPLPNQIEY